jgi:hypothetical protein
MSVKKTLKNIEQEHSEPEDTAASSTMTRRLQYELVRKEFLKKMAELEKTLDAECIDEEEIKGGDDDYMMRRKKNGGAENRILPMCTEDEAQRDLDEINGIKPKTKKNLSEPVSVSGGVLKIGSREFVKGDLVKANIYGEIYIGNLGGLNFSEVNMKTKDGEKVKIQVSSLRNGKITMSKLKQQEEE